MNRKNLIFAAVLFAALSLGFVSCDNKGNEPDDPQGEQTEQSGSTENNGGGEETQTPDPDEGEGDSSDTPSSNFTPVSFSVSTTQQVYFSSGNLQYIQSSDTWQFASCQWECVGTDNVTGGEVTSDAYGYYREGTALADKVDLFGWSTGATIFGVSTSTDWENGYLGSFVDWGSNQIGDDVPNTWRTLTYDEWDYLRWERENYDALCGIAQVNGINGLILLPDGWSCPDGVTFQSGFHDSYGVEYYAAYQTFTADEWSKMESAGAVFLPAAGRRYGSGVDYVQDLGYYWSATESDSRGACYLYFNAVGAYVDGDNRYSGRSVRLVKDL